MRQFDLKGLGLLREKCRERVEQIRAERQSLLAGLKTLESSESRRTYTPQHLNEERAALRRNSLQRVRSINAELSELVRPAFTERYEWSRGALLSSTDALVDTTDKQTRILARLEASMRRMELSNRLARMSDDSLLDYAEQQTRLGDNLSATMAAEEARTRGGIVGVETARLLSSLACPEADQSAMIYDQLERDLREASAVEENIEFPDDNRSYATVRSLEIARQASEDAAEEQKSEPEGASQQLSSDAPDIDFSSFIRPGTDAA